MLFTVEKMRENPQVSRQEVVKLVHCMLEKLWQYNRVLRNLFSYDGQNSIYSIFFKMSQEYISARLGGSPDTYLVELCYGYAYARAGLMKHWLENGVDFSSERCAEVMMDLCPPMLAEAFGWTE